MSVTRDVVTVLFSYTPNPCYMYISFSRSLPLFGITAPTIWGMNSVIYSFVFGLIFTF